MCKEYNGWTNYETWNVALWLDNDYGLYSLCQEQAQEFANDSDTPHADLADWLKELVCDELYPEYMANDASMYTDLLGAALSSVNWYEIAEHYLEDVEQEDDPEDDE